MTNPGKSATVLALALGLLALLALPLAVVAQPPGGVARQTVEVALHQSEILQLDQPVAKISVGNPEIADILILQSRQLYVVGKKLGSTNVTLWDNRGQVIRAVGVEVTHDLEGLKSKLHQVLPGETIEVRSSQGAIVLSGEVSSAARMEAALQLARSYRGGDDKDAGGVLNMMQVGGAQQVMLEVQVAEVSRNFLKSIGAKFQALNADGHLSLGGTNGGSTLGPAAPTFGGGQAMPSIATEILRAPLGIATTGLFASYLDGSTLFDLVIEAAQENGLAKVLAEPTLTTLTGQEATFHAGGEFPIPVAGGTNQGTRIIFKDFGINLGFLPTVLDSGTISLKLNIKVSELSNQNAVAVSVPDTGTAFFVNSLTTRSASSTVELGNGQTMGIAGLINENLRERVNKFPGLGDLPILGHLFRSQEFVQGKTELVILVTPHFAKPVQREQLTLPTDAFVEPSDMEFYLLGYTEGRSSKTAEQRPPAGQGSVAGQFGHEL